MDYSVTELGIRCSDVVAVKESMIYVGIISLNIQNIYNKKTMVRKTRRFKIEYLIKEFLHNNRK